MAEVEETAEGRFERLLFAHRDGGLSTDLDEAVRKLVGQVELTGKAGTVTVKITVKPAGKDTSGAVFVSDVITVKAPENHPESFFFTNGVGDLTRRNERQLGYDGPLLEVAERKAGAELKEV